MKAIVGLGIGTTLTTWLIGLVPLQEMGLSHFVTGILFHVISLVSSLFLIWIFVPKLDFHRAIFQTRPFMIGLGIMLYFTVPQIFSSSLFSNKFELILQAIVFSFAIGIDEEVFSRRFIFGLLEKYGIWTAAAISSVHFGLLHFTNLRSGQSLSVTIAQVVSASGFGFLCCGLYVYTRSLFIPIAFHALSDLPMLVESKSQYIARAQGEKDWGFVIVELCISILIGVVIINLSKKSQPRVSHVQETP